MKKLVALFSALLLSLALAAFIGCEEEKGSALEGSVTVVLDKGEGAENRYTEFTLDLAEAGLTTADHAIDVLEALKEREGLYYSGTYTSSFGAYLTEIGTETPAENPSYEGETVQTPILKAEGSSYIALYTSDIDEGNPDADSYGGTIEYEGVSVYYAMLGVSSLSLSGGAVYYFMLSSY